MDGTHSGTHSGDDWLARDFEAHRTHLRAVALRVLGSSADADDAVQEAWFRLSRSDTGEVANLRGWLTTVVARISLDMLRSRASRREDGWDSWDSGLADLVDAASADVRPVTRSQPPDPAAEAELADSVGLALLVVLDTLAPAERLAFVLHDLFGLPFEQIADVVDRSPAATRQLASRARRRVRAADVDLDDERPGELGRQRHVVDAFLTAARGGDLTRLLELLAPDAVIRSDAAAVAMGSPAAVDGREAVGAFFDGAAKSARLAAFDGSVGAVWALRGEPQVAFVFTVEDGRVTRVEFRGDPDYLGGLTVDYLH